jgi:hypothetical protein
VSASSWILKKVKIEEIKNYIQNRSSSLLVLQPCLGLGLLRGFVTVDFSGVGLLAPRPTPNLEDQGLHFVWSLPFDLSGMGGATRSLRSRQHTSPCHWGAETSST